MIKIIKLDEQLSDFKNSVSYRTDQGHRVDISKKFISRTSNEVFTIFTKNKKDKSAGFVISLNEVYVVEVTDTNHASEASGKPILMIKDLVPYGHIFRYVETIQLLEKSPIQLW